MEPSFLVSAPAQLIGSTVHRHDGRSQCHETRQVGAVFLDDWWHAQFRMNWGMHDTENCDRHERLNSKATVGTKREGHRGLAERPILERLRTTTQEPQARLSRRFSRHSLRGRCSLPFYRRYGAPTEACLCLSI